MTREISNWFLFNTMLQQTKSIFRLLQLYIKLYIKLTNNAVCILLIRVRKNVIITRATIKRHFTSTILPSLQQEAVRQKHHSHALCTIDRNYQKLMHFMYLVWIIRCAHTCIMELHIYSFDIDTVHLWCHYFNNLLNVHAYMEQYSSLVMTQL